MYARFFPPAVSISIVALLVIALVVITGHCGGTVGFSFNLGVR